MSTDRLITLKGFINKLVEQHEHRKDRPFFFILGAGASCASGIPSGSTMALDWLKMLHEDEDFDGKALEEWATAENLDISEFDFAEPGRFYPQIYAKRYADSGQAGYAYLEDKMQGKEPSFGYSVLAYILSETPHKIVITTNFDNLVADALSIHSTTFPIVVSHDALADYAQVDLRRPLIAKVHGGLGFSMKSKEDELTTLDDKWQNALRKIFERYSPIVIGYDGNDGSLMSFMEGMPDEAIDGFYWCFHCPDEDPREGVKKVPQRVKNLVEKKHARLVAIPGFDELMLLLKQSLGEKIGMPDLLERMKGRARQREQSYDEQQRKLTESLNSTTHKQRKDQTSEAKNLTAVLLQAASAAVKQRPEKPWWSWEMEASAAISKEEKEQVYKKALNALPQSAPLLGNYALFLETERKEMDQAEEFYKRAIEADPKNANNLGIYAVFLKNERKEMDQAQEIYKRAIEADPKHAINLGNYAAFLQTERKEMDQAEDFYKRAIEADPKHANSLGNYAAFLQTERKEMDQAEEFYKRSIESDPKHTINLGNYANFLRTERKEMDQAEDFYKRAIEADPKDADYLGCYAFFLQTERKEMDQAEEFYKRAIEADPKHTINLGNYAVFLKNESKEMDQAEEFYKRAIEVDPKNAINLGNYAVFLQTERKKMDQAEEFYKRAIEADPKNANCLGNYAQLLLTKGNSAEGLDVLSRAEAENPAATELQLELAFYRIAHDPAAWPSGLKKVAKLLQDGVRTPGWSLTGNVEAATKAKHPNIPLLQAIADITSHGATLEPLASFPDWSNFA